jgi:hypothetical protein
MLPWPTGGPNNYWLAVLLPDIYYWKLTKTSVSLNPLEKAERTSASGCFSISPGVVENIRYAISRCPASAELLNENRALNISGHSTSIHYQFD